MNHETPGAAPADDFPFLGPAVSPRRRDVSAPLGGPAELAAPFVSRPSPEAPTPLQGGTPQPPTEPERQAEELEPLPGAGWPTEDFPWLMPAQPEAPGAQAEPAWGATGGGSAASAPADADEGFPWDEDVAPDAAAADRAGSGWEGEPMLGAEGAERASSAAWGIDPEEEEPGVEDLYTTPAAGYGWHEEAEVVEEAEDLTVSAADDLAGGEAPGWAADAAPSFERPERAPEPSGWAWSDAGYEAQEEAGLGDRWQASEESFAMDEEAPERAAETAVAPEAAAEWHGEYAAEPQATPVEAAALPVGEWEAEAEVVEVQDEPRAPGAVAAGAADPLEDVAARLERIARALRTGKPDEALEQGDPLQLLITGYALGYAEARKGRGQG